MKSICITSRQLVWLIVFVFLGGCAPAPTTVSEQDTLVTIPVTVVPSPTEIPTNAPIATPTTTASPTQTLEPIPLTPAKPMILESIDEAPIGCAVLEPSDDGWSSVDNGTRQFNGIGSEPIISLSPGGNRIIINDLGLYGTGIRRNAYSILDLDTDELYRFEASDRVVDSDMHIWVDEDRLLMVGDEDRIMLIDFSDSEPQATVLLEDFASPIAIYPSQRDESTYVFLNRDGLAFTFDIETGEPSNLAPFSEFAVENAGDTKIRGVSNDGWVLGNSQLAGDYWGPDHYLTLYNPETGEQRETVLMVQPHNSYTFRGHWRPAKQLGQSSIWKISDDDFIIPDDGTLDQIPGKVIYNGVFVNLETGDVLDWEDFGLERQQVVIGGDVLPGGKWAIVYLVDEVAASVPEMTTGGYLSENWPMLVDDVYIAPADDLTTGFYFENTRDALASIAFWLQPRNTPDNIIVLNHNDSDMVSLIDLSDRQPQVTDFTDDFRIIAVFDTFMLTYQYSDAVLTVSQRDFNGTVLDSITYEGRFRRPESIVMNENSIYMTLLPVFECWEYDSALVEWSLAEEMLE